MYNLQRERCKKMTPKEMRVELLKVLRLWERQEEIRAAEVKWLGGQLKEAITKEMTLCESITDIYEGDAREEMEMFLGSLTQQTDKLLQFYMQLQSFITQTYETFYHHDELMMGYRKSRGFIIE